MAGRSRRAPTRSARPWSEPRSVRWIDRVLIQCDILHAAPRDNGTPNLCAAWGTMRYGLRVAMSQASGPAAVGPMTPPRRVGVPPLNLGGQAVADRLDRHFAAMVDAPPAARDDGNATEALETMIAVLPRTGNARAKRSERGL